VSEKKTPSTYVAENGITFGVIVLALFVIFGVGLPRWIHEDDTSSRSTAKIELPASLSGGYVSADSAASWKDAVAKKQVPQQTATSLQQQATQLSKQAEKNIEALGAGAASRMYVDTAHGSLMVVSAVRDRSAFMQGLTGNIQKVGTSLCNVGSSSSSGSVVDCSRTSDDLTVEIQVQGGTPSAATTAKHIDEVWTKIS
jgi:hypothetical protein